MLAENQAYVSGSDCLQGITGCFSSSKEEMNQEGVRFSFKCMDLNRVNPCFAGLDKTKPCVISSLASLEWWEGNHSQRDRCPDLSLVLPSAPLPVFSMDENQPEA